MSVAQTSWLAYMTLTKLSDKQETVRDKIEQLGRVTNEELAAALGWAINRVTPRTNELWRYGLIAVDGTKIGQSGKSAKAWVICDPDDRKVKQLLREA